MRKPCIGEIETEPVLPVDARPHRRGGLPVGKVLAEPQELTKLKIFEVTPIAS